VTIHLRVPDKFRARSVRFYSPDDEKTVALDFRQEGNLVKCRTPGFLVEE